MILAVNVPVAAPGELLERSAASSSSTGFGALPETCCRRAGVLTATAPVRHDLAWI